MKSTAIILSLLLLCVTAYTVAETPTSRPASASAPASQPASAPAPTIKLIQSTHYGNYLSVSNANGTKLLCSEVTTTNSQWIVHENYGGHKGATAFESVAKPGHFIVVSDDRLAVQKIGPEFNVAASFSKEAPKSTTKSIVSVKDAFTLSPAAALDRTVETTKSGYSPTIKKTTINTKATELVMCNMVFVDPE